MCLGVCRFCAGFLLLMQTDTLWCGNKTGFLSVQGVKHGVKQFDLCATSLCFQLRVCVRRSVVACGLLALTAGGWSGSSLLLGAWRRLCSSQLALTP